MACTEADPPAEEAPPRQPQALVADLPDDCGSIGPAPRRAEISFVANGNLYVASPDKTKVRCATSAEGATELEWGARADRLLFGGLDRHIDEGRAIVSSESSSISMSTWSRPTGTSIVFVKRGRLFKVGAEESEPRDISFLARHDSVIYHPAGTHIVSTGVEAKGDRAGIFLADNEGRKPRPLVANETARSIDSLAFSHDGNSLYFSADHGDTHDLHRLSLAPGSSAGDTGQALAEMELDTVFDSTDPVTNIHLSEHDDRSLSFRTGSCETGFRTYSTAPDGDRDDFVELDEAIYGSFTEAVGWTPKGELMVLVQKSGCDGPAELWRTKPGRGLLFARGVTLASVRAELPPPPDPPLPAQEVPA